MFGKVFDKTKHPALRIDFAVPITAEKTQAQVTFMMEASSIEDFIYLLRKLSTNEVTKREFKESSLVLTLRESPFGAKSQLQTSLQPFGLVYGLRDMIIRGQVEPACAQAILHRAGAGYKDMAQIQSISQAYVDKGGEAYLGRESMKAFDL